MEPFEIQKDFPSSSYEDKETNLKFEIDCKTFLTCLQKVVPFLSKRTGDITQNTLIKFREDTITFVATDRVKLAVVNLNLKTNARNKKVLISGESVKNIIKTFNKKERATIILWEEHCLIKTDRVGINVKFPVENPESYPEYEQILRMSRSRKIIKFLINRNLFLLALDIPFLLKNKIQPAKLSLKNNSLILTASLENTGDITKEIVLESSLSLIEPFIISVDINQITQLLKATKETILTVKFLGPSEPIFIYGKLSEIFVVMPLRQ